MHVVPVVVAILRAARCILAHSRLSFNPLLLLSDELDILLRDKICFGVSTSLIRQRHRQPFIDIKKERVKAR